MGRRCALFTEADLKRALKVVKEFGLVETTRIVITRAGDIVIEPLTDDAMITIDALVTGSNHDNTPKLEVVPAHQISL